MLIKVGPEAEVALPKLAEMLPDKRHVVIARRTMDQIKPGHFAQLPRPLRGQADTALYEAVIDPESQELASFFAVWLSEESRLKLLRSQESQHRALALRIVPPLGQWSDQVEAEVLRILLAEDEQLRIRQDAARALGRSNKLSREAKAALLTVLKVSPPYAQNISNEERTRQTELQSLSKEAGRALGSAGPSIIDELLPLVTPLDNHFRPGAMEALFRLGSAGVPRLIGLLGNQDEAIGISASVALNRIGSPAVPALIRALDSENEQVVDQALSALWWIGQGAKDAIPDLLMIVASQDQPERIRIAAARTAIKIAPNDSRVNNEISKAMPRLIGIFQGREAKYQGWAAEVLRQLGSDAKSALPALRAFVEREPSDDHEYRAARRDSRTSNRRA